MPDRPGSADEPQWLTPEAAGTIPPLIDQGAPGDVSSDRGAVYAESTSDPANVLHPPPFVPSSFEQRSEAAETHRVTDVEMSGGEPNPPTASPQPLPEFDPRCREDLEGLLFIGALSDSFTWMGHRFTIRTLLMDELLQIALAHKEYLGSMGDVKAMQSFMVAACVQTVDGKDLPVPAFVNETFQIARFNYCTKNWYPYTFDAIYEKYLELEARTLEVMEAMGEALGSMV